MHEATAPVNNITFSQNRKETLEQLRRLGVTKRVIIAVGGTVAFGENTKYL